MKETYQNGQRMYEQKGDVRTVYYEDGTKRAKGKWVNGIMNGTWTFWRKSGQLWQVGHFKDNQKHGRFIRYDKNDHIEYDETFKDGKVVKK